MQVIADLQIIIRDLTVVVLVAGTIDELQDAPMVEDPEVRTIYSEDRMDTDEMREMNSYQVPNQSLVRVIDLMVDPIIETRVEDHKQPHRRAPLVNTAKWHLISRGSNHNS